MIKTNYGDILNNVEQGIIVHGCNCQGKMGSGIAKQIKDRYPQVFKIYRDDYERGVLSLGKISFVYVDDRKIIVNAMTQNFYGADGKRYVSYDAIKECFKKINDLAQVDKLPVNFPMIGAGLGGGDWNEIENIIDETLEDNIEKNLWILK